MLVLLEGLASTESEVTVAELTMVVPAAGAPVPVLTFTVMTMEFVEAFAASALLNVQVIGPALPFPGVVHVQFVAVTLVNVVLGGVCWYTTTLPAGTVAVPMFFATSVYV